MKLARVVGTVVSTINSPIFEDRTLLLCDLVEPTGEAAGGYLIAVDTVGAGAGELVLILDEGTSARQIVGAAYGPLRTVIVGIVDAVEGPASVAGSGSAGAGEGSAAAGEGARSDAATSTASTGMAGAKPTARRTRRRVPQG